MTKEQNHLTGSYPIKDSDEELIVTISTPHPFPPLTETELLEVYGDELSEAERKDWVLGAKEDTSKRVTWSLKATNYEKEGSVGGVDDLQALLLAFKVVMDEIEAFEQATKQTCLFTFATNATLSLDFDEE